MPGFCTSAPLTDTGCAMISQAFDFLKSLPIEEKVNRIEFLPPALGGVVLLTANGASCGLSSLTVTNRARLTPPPAT